MSKARQQPQPDDPVIEAERALLGRILADDRVWWDVSDRVQAEDLTDKRHRAIWIGMQTLAANGRPISRPALLAQIGADGGEIPLSTYLASLPAHAAQVRGAVSEFADIVLHRSGRRQIVDAAERMRDRALTAGMDVPLADIVAEAQRAISATDSGESEDVQIGKLISQTISQASEASRSQKPRGVMTGLKSLDELIGPMLGGQLIIIAGETGSGKTALATQAGVMCAEQGIPTDMTSLEMEDHEIAARVLAAASDTASERIVSGKLTEAELDRLMEMGGRMLDLPFYVNSQPRQSVGMIYARTARAIARHGIKLKIIDHVQYIRPDNPRAKEHEQVKQVVDDCKAMAKRLHIPIILISHVNRPADFNQINRAADVRRPTLSSLYGSSAIEKAADAVVFVHRPSWFLERATPLAKYKGECAADLLAWSDKAELVQPKKRGGKGYAVKECYFDGERTWFSDMPAMSVL